MGSAVSDSRSSTASGSDRSCKPHRNRRPGNHVPPAHLNDDGRPDVRLHVSDCDQMYRWAMWRMYINEQIARAARGRSIVDVISPYLHHPDGRRFGRMMKKKFKSSRLVDPQSEHILPDNFYLVFGLPRVSLQQTVPAELKELRASAQQDCLYLETEIRVNDKDEEDTQITANNWTVRGTDTVVEDDKRSKVFEHSLVNLVNNTEADLKGDRLASGAIVDKQASKDSNGISGTMRKSTLPLASKSRLFWQKLAERKSEIIDIDKTNISKKPIVLEPPKCSPSENGEKKDVSNTHQSSTTNGNIESGISSEILLKQHKLLKKTTPKARSSKDLWKSLADRKTEILLLQDTNDKDSRETKQKRNERKTSNLWGFIFSKKKDLMQMKKGVKAKPDKQPITDNASSTIKPAPPPAASFQDNFQTELEARLRKRRENSQNKANHTTETQ